MAKSILVLLYEPVRKAAQEFGRRFKDMGILKERSDIYHCSWAEAISVITGYWDGFGLDVLVSERKLTMKEMESLSAPDFIIGETPQVARQVIQLNGNILEGIGVSAGKVTGIARLISHPNEAEKLQPGDILVAPSTDPGWTPLFLKVSAIVMETGGFLAHGAIVAREYGVPAVVNIPGVMNIIKDGQKIFVDGDEGKVFLTPL
jgi:pyruvate,water dikinase